MLLEDHQGIIWAGTHLGLLRYDGIETKLFLQQKGNANSLSNEFIYDLFEDKDHFLWIATRNGLTSLDPSRNKFTRYQMDTEDESTLPNNRIFSLLPDSDTTFFILCDKSGLSSFNIKTGRVNRLNPKIQSELEPDHNGEVWVSRAFKTANGKILVSARQSLYEYDRTRNILRDIVDTQTGFHDIPEKSSFFCSQEGMMWFMGADRTLYKWLPDETLIPFNQPDLVAALKPGRTKMLDYNHTHLLISTVDDYVLVNKENGKMQFLRFRKDQLELPSPDQITHSIETQTEIIMLASLKGDVYVINPLLQQFKIKHVNDQDPNALVQKSVCDFFDDPLYSKRYISVFHDSLYYIEDLLTGEITSYPSLNLSNIANRWLLDKTGRLWISNSTGVLEIDRVTHKAKSFLPDTPAVNLFEIVEIEKGRMLVGSFQNGIFLFEPDRNVFQKVPEKKGWISTQVFSLKSDPKHHSVWIGTVRNGLFRYDILQDSFIHYTYNSRNPNSIGGDWVRDITIDSSGHVWFSTDPIGLSRFDHSAHPDSAFINLSTEDGLPTNYVSGLLTDQKGHIWMTSMNGIASLDPSTMKIKFYGKDDGIPFTRFYHANVNLAFNGKVLIGMPEGYLHFHPDSLATNHLPPKLMISDFLVFDTSRFEVDRNGEIIPIQLSYKENYITIRLSVINYTESQLNTVRYKMEGLDKNWNTRTGISEISYTNVPPGNYTFRILAANNDGLWNDQETTLSIVIRPPFWQRTWFYILMGSLLAALIFAMYTYKLKQTIREKLLISEQEKIKSESERLLGELEMKALRAQMNPHFIFNCLNSINRFIVINDNDTASEYLTKFSRLIRQVLENSRGEKIGLANEIESLRMYIEMESLRFVDKFEYKITVASDLNPADYMIQPMLIQPYVENAIWHGLMHRKTKGQLLISFATRGNSLQVVIHDNGVGREKAKSIKEHQLISRKSFGMKVTAERMALLSKQLNVPVEANVEDLYDDQNLATGTQVNLTLPLETKSSSLENSNPLHT